MKNHFFISCFVLCCCGLLLTSCGYHLRGYDTPVFASRTIDLKVANTEQIHNKASRNLEKHITTRLLVLGATVNSHYSKRNQLTRNLASNVPSTNNLHTQNPKPHTTVTVKHIELNKHELVGTLTEIQLLMTADVRIVTANKTPLVRTLRVQRSYQYNQATVNTENQQEDRIIELMNEAMADKIARQVALYDRIN